MSQFQPLQLEPLASEPTIPSLEKGTESSPDLEPVEKFPTRQTLEPIDRGETSKLTGKARAQELWQKVRDVYKPKRRTSRFYALYKRVMEDKIKAYREFEALNIPPGGWRRPQRPAESEDTTTEEEEEKQEKKQRKQWRKLRVSQVFRREPEKVEINEKVEIEKVRDITGMELAENLIAWMNNMGIDLKVLADKICVVDKTEEDLIQELSLLIATALFTKTGNDCSWPKYEDWRMVLLNDGTAPSAHLYWQALRERKSEFSNVIHDEDMLKLVFCRNPHQRQKLLKESHDIFFAELAKLRDPCCVALSMFGKYRSLDMLFYGQEMPQVALMSIPASTSNEWGEETPKGAWAPAKRSNKSFHYEHPMERIAIKRRSYNRSIFNVREMEYGERTAEEGGGIHVRYGQVEGLDVKPTQVFGNVNDSASRSFQTNIPRPSGFQPSFDDSNWSDMSGAVHNMTVKSNHQQDFLKPIPPPPRVTNQEFQMSGDGSKGMPNDATLSFNALRGRRLHRHSYPNFASTLNYHTASVPLANGTVFQPTVSLPAIHLPSKGDSAIELTKRWRENRRSARSARKSTILPAIPNASCQI